MLFFKKKTFFFPKIRDFRMSCMLGLEISSSQGLKKPPKISPRETSLFITRANFKFFFNPRDEKISIPHIGKPIPVWVYICLFFREIIMRTCHPGENGNFLPGSLSYPVRNYHFLPGDECAWQFHRKKWSSVNKGIEIFQWPGRR